MARINFNELTAEQLELYESSRLEGVYIGTSENDTLIGRPRSTGESLIDFGIVGSRLPTVDGLGGDDVLIGSLLKANSLAGGPGSDKITGGKGDDKIRVGSPVAVTGSKGFRQDSINDKNIVRALGGKDQISIGNGIDIVYAGSGNDTFFFNEGSTIDFLQSGGKGGDKIFGQKGEDLIVHGDDKGRLDGGADDDTVIGGLGNDNIIGQGGNDVLYGDLLRVETGFTTVSFPEGFYKRAYDTYLSERTKRQDGNDKIDGGKGADAIYGEGGNDTLRGGKGNDVIYGGKGQDRLYGDDDNDRLYGEEGIDELYAGKGFDELYGGKGNDVLFSGLGYDVLRGNEDKDTLNIGAKVQSTIDTAFTINASVVNARGGSGNDIFNIRPRISGTITTDRLTDGRVLDPADRPNFVYGEDGADTFNFLKTRNEFETRYGDAQVTIIRGFEPGKDKIAFGDESPDNLRTQSVGAGTNVYVTVQATFGPGIDIIGDLFDVQLARIEGFRNVELDNTDFFKF